MDCLEEEKRTVFFFIDDIDRAIGDQIRDLLSELKLYVSHRRIVAVLGFDEDYVLSALKSPVLPSGIEPKKYLEKIVTIRRNVPIPSPDELAVYAKHLLLSMLVLPEHADRLGLLAARLSSNNPRRLKNLVLTFTQFLSSTKYEKLNFGDLASFLITSTAANMGFLADKRIRETMEGADENEIISAIQEFVKKDSSKIKEAEVLINAVRLIEPNFRPDTLRKLRLFAPLSPPHAPVSMRDSRQQEGFDWSGSLIPILTSAAMRGFKLPPETVESSSKIIVPQSTKTKSLGVKYKGQTRRIKHLLGSVEKSSCVLSWNQSDMIVLLTSSLSKPIRAGSYIREIETFFDECAHFVAEKSFIIWLIVDLGTPSESYLKRLIGRAQKISKGLKHPFLFQYTSSSKIKLLLTFLLDVASKVE